MRHVRQTRLQSLWEASINIFIGFWINYCANLVILPLFGLHITLVDNFLLGLMYTGVSVLRGYAIRRWFDAKIDRAARRLAELQK